MTKKTQWIHPEELPENIQDMISRFEQAFCTHTTGYKITNLLPYAVWFLVYGRCSAYKLARLALNSPDCYVEVIATAPNYFTVSMASSPSRGEVCIHYARRPLDRDYKLVPS